MLFNNIETDRLILKNIAIDDKNFIFNHFSNDVVNRYLFDGEPGMQRADEIITFYVQPEPRIQHRWIVMKKSDGTKMGTCGFHCWNQEDCKVEVGYDLKEEFWGKGFMQEAMKEIILFAMNEMHIKEISACIYIDNQRSIRLAENLGFVLSGTMYQSFRNKEYLHNIYSFYVTGLV
jgi:ribosomal-protein-alanine N-acetyltransferase